MSALSTLERTGNRRWIFPAVGIGAALVTNTIANIGVLPAIGAFLLFPLLLTFWYLERFSRRRMGFVSGKAGYYVIGLLHPVLVLSLMALTAWLVGATNIQYPDWPKIVLTVAANALVTIPATIVTEDGFFRGWLWASLHRAGLTEQRIVLLTGIAFGVWHLPYALLRTGYGLVSAEVPLLIINASVIGIAWGVLRLLSGSLVVAAVAHGIWNGAVYVLFNYGAEAGALGITNTLIFGPEAGLVGLAFNLAYAVALWLWYRRAASMRSAQATNPG